MDVDRGCCAIGHTLNLRRLGEVHVVHSIHDILRTEHVAAVEAAIQALDCVLPALHAVELDIDLTVGAVEGDADMNDVTILFFALGLDVVF